MSLPELTTPIRIYWDITPLPECPPNLDKIAADLVDLKILNVDIAATGPVIPASCFPVIDRLNAARIAVTLTVSPAALTEGTASHLATSPPKELLFETGSLAEFRAVIPKLPKVSGISFPLNQENWRQIPDVISLSAANGLQRIVFPMQRLYRGEVPFYIPGQELGQITATIALHLPDSGLKITVHDPFVWRAIFPHVSFPEGRCQAANTMLSIDSSGIVYPCPVMPIALGDLSTCSLKEIARGAMKKELRARLLRLPADCENCISAEICRGGCRGRGERVFGTWESIDPGCR